MSSELGRCLQPDPIGFKGDGSNLYRYCGNDSVNKSDPLGLENPPARILPDRQWESSMYWDTANNYQGSFNDWMNRNSIRPQAGMGDNAGGGGTKSGPSESEVAKHRANTKPYALDMLREEARGTKDQTGEIVLQDGEIRRAGPVEERYVKRNPFSPSSGNVMAREHLKTGGRALWIVHYHRRGGNEKYPTPDDYAAMRQEKAPMMFTSRDLAKGGHYQILRLGFKPETLYDRQLYLEHHADK
jgi:uncharacterized protein RhaS with RHS repeats